MSGADSVMRAVPAFACALAWTACAAWVAPRMSDGLRPVPVRSADGLFIAVAGAPLLGRGGRLAAWGRRWEAGYGGSVLDVHVYTLAGLRADHASQQQRSCNRQVQGCSGL